MAPDVLADHGASIADDGVLWVAGAAGEAGLDLHKGISTPKQVGCPRWPPGLFLQSSLDHVVKGRCRATNLCAYCARLSAVENSELLALDALTNTPPRVWLVLTTRRASIDPSDFYRAREKLMKALRRRWPALEYACVLEFTTGFGPRSGGKRRRTGTCC